MRELEQKKTNGGQPLEANTINKILARVRTMLNDAFESGAIVSARNPMTLVRNLTVAEREIDPFDPAELLRIFAVCEVNSVPFTFCWRLAGCGRPKL